MKFSLKIEDDTFFLSYIAVLLNRDSMFLNEYILIHTKHINLLFFDIYIQ